MLTNLKTIDSIDSVIDRFTNPYEYKLN